MQRIPLTANDTWPLTGTIANASGAIDITGWSIALEIAYETPISISGSITDATGGIYQIPFSAGQLVAGEYDAALRIANASGKIITTNRVRLVISPEIIAG